MQHNSDFESGYFDHHDDLGECSQIFKPTSALVDFLEKSKKEMAKETGEELGQCYDKTEHQSITIKFGIALYREIEKTETNAKD